jgi:imidazolonepropionase
MLKLGTKQGWNINFHAEEIEYIGGTEMGCKLGARAISHLEKVSDEAIKMMAEVS